MTDSKEIVEKLREFKNFYQTGLCSIILYDDEDRSRTYFGTSKEHELLAADLYYYSLTHYIDELEARMLDQSTVSSFWVILKPSDDGTTNIDADVMDAVLNLHAVWIDGK